MNVKQNESKPAEVFTEELILRAKRGEQSAFTTLYELTQQDVYRTIHALTRDEQLVLDVQQDTYLRAFERLDQLKNPESFPAWVRRIAVNETKNQLARKRPLLFSELDSPDGEAFEPQLPDLSALPEAQLEQAERKKLLDEILQTLTPEQQLVVGMYYYEQIPANEIAKELGVNAGTVHTQLHRGRKKIEAGVRELERKGIRLYGLSPLPFLLSLLRGYGAEKQTERRVLGEVLRRSAEKTPPVGMLVGRRFFETAAGKLVLGVLVAGILGGGAVAYRAVWDLNNPPPAGDFRPPETQTAPLPGSVEPTAERTRHEPAPFVGKLRDAQARPLPLELPLEETLPEETTPEETKPEETKPTEPRQEAPKTPPAQETPTQPKPTDPPRSEPAETEPESPEPPPVYQPRTVLKSFDIPSGMYPGDWTYFSVSVYGEGEVSMYTDRADVLNLEPKGRSYDNPYANDGDTIVNGVYYGKAREWIWYASALSAGTANIYCVIGGQTTLLTTVTVEGGE